MCYTRVDTNVDQHVYLSSPHILIDTCMKYNILMNSWMSHHTTYQSPLVCNTTCNILIKNVYISSLVCYTSVDQYVVQNWYISSFNIRINTCKKYSILINTSISHHTTHWSPIVHNTTHQHFYISSHNVLITTCTQYTILINTCVPHHTTYSLLHLECHLISISNPQSHWSLFNKTWQKRSRELDHWLRFEKWRNHIRNAIGCCTNQHLYAIYLIIDANCAAALSKWCPWTNPLFTRGNI